MCRISAGVASTVSTCELPKQGVKWVRSTWPWSDWRSWTVAATPVITGESTAVLPPEFGVYYVIHSPSWMKFRRAGVILSKKVECTVLWFSPQLDQSMMRKWIITTWLLNFTCFVAFLNFTEKLQKKKKKIYVALNLYKKGKEILTIICREMCTRSCLAVTLPLSSSLLFTALSPKLNYRLNYTLMTEL